MPAIFISYRRDGALVHARAIFERLKHQLGKEKLFIDIEGICLGYDFVDVVNEQLDDCRVLLALIDPNWSAAVDQSGSRRLDLESDFVRIEIATALERGIPVIPVLLDGASLPQASTLPEVLRSLTRRQAFQFDFNRFDAHADHLAAQINSILQSAPILPSARLGRVVQPGFAGSLPPPQALSRDEHGVYSDFVIVGKYGTATQRFRWIEPGEFMMGSSKGEIDRGPVETAQRLVRVEPGFWLADSACTQALWSAVMGSNPSVFIGEPQRPVEQVKFPEVQQFLSRINPLLPGYRVHLPTAERWEYACRAGTTTAFSFGNQISTDQVNYDGNEPYAGGAKGQRRGRTVAVKSLPPNAWGLYEMHGNVWEWCDNVSSRTVGVGPATFVGYDSVREEPVRAVRGGCWDMAASMARAAVPMVFPEHFYAGVIGFRLCVDAV